MGNIKIDATDRSPEIDFDFGANTFVIKGESYPEDVSTFYGPVVNQLEEHLSDLEDGSVKFNFELIYFNSSSAKVLMGIFDALDECASNGNDIQVTRYYDAEDDTMQELGEEFAKDLENAKFELKTID